MLEQSHKNQLILCFSPHNFWID